MSEDSSVSEFARVFFEHRGKLVDKWEQYLGAYQAELAPFRMSEKPVDLLEIGVQNGGSLEFWAKILPHGSSILGLDIDPLVGNLTFDNPAIRTAVIDATDASQLEAVLGDATFDIIIDDGSHICSAVKKTLGLLYPKLRLNGCYFIEDLHTSYFPSYGGGYLSTESSVEYLKHALDILNIDHFSPLDRQAGLDELLPTMASTLGSITFYDSLAVLRKLKSVKTKPWRRLISGERTDVVSFESWVGQASHADLDRIIFGELAAKSFENALGTARSQVRGDDSQNSCSEEAEVARVLQDMVRKLRHIQDSIRDNDVVETQSVIGMLEECIIDLCHTGASIDA